MKNMSKTKLTYITPVLDFVQAESEWLLGNASEGVLGSGGGTDPKPEGDWEPEEPEAKDFYFQFDDSDADFFYLD